MQVKYLQQYQIYCVKVKATYILMIIRKVLTGPSKAHYLGAQTQDSHKESFHFWVIVNICFPLFHLLSWLSSDQFRVVAFIIFFSFLFFCRKKKKIPEVKILFHVFYITESKRTLLWYVWTLLLCIWVVEETEFGLVKKPKESGFVQYY